MHRLERVYRAVRQDSKAKLIMSLTEKQNRSGLTIDEETLLAAEREANPDVANCVSFYTAYSYDKHILEVDNELFASLINAKFPANYPCENFILPRPESIILSVQNEDFILYHGIVDNAPGICIGMRDARIINGKENLDVQGIGYIRTPPGATLGEDCVRVWHREGMSEQALVITKCVVIGLINTILYILGDNETVEQVHPGSSPKKIQRLIKSNTGECIEPKVERIGRQYARLIKRYAEEEAADISSGSSSGNTGRTTKPHIRSAHAHIYWTGPGRKIPQVKFIAPVYVKGGGHLSTPDDKPTITTVK